MFGTKGGADAAPPFVNTIYDLRTKDILLLLLRDEI